MMVPGINNMQTAQTLAEQSDGAGYGAISPAGRTPEGKSCSKQSGRASTQAHSSINSRASQVG